MGFLSWVGGILGGGSKDTVGGGLIESAKRGIDVLIFTEQEKKEMSMKTMELWLKHQAMVADESSIRSITRRYIALCIIGVFLLGLVGGVVVWRFDPLWAERWFEMSNSLKTMAMMVAGFYFGYYAATKIIDKMKK